MGNYKIMCNSREVITLVSHYNQSINIDINDFDSVNQTLN